MSSGGWEDLRSDYIDAMAYAMRDEQERMLIRLMGTWIDEAEPVPPEEPRGEPMQLTYANLCKKRKEAPGAFTAETVKSIQYIEDLANLSRVNLDTWDMEIFNEGALGFSVQLDKDKLNQKFFDEMERRSKDPSVPKIVAQVLEGQSLSNFYHEHIETMAKEYEYNAKVHMDRAVLNYNTANKETKSAHENHKKAASIRGRAIDITARVNKVLQDGRWRYKSFNSPWVIFEPTMDIWQNYRNPAAQEHYRVNYGKLQVYLGVSEAKILVLPGENAVRVDSSYHGTIYHPHVNEAGTVCWGSGAADATRGLAEGDYERVFAILFTILTTYNPESPYATLAKFQAKQPDNKPGFVPRLCEKCGHNLEIEGCQCCGVCAMKPDDCTCQYCQVCDAKYPRDGSCPSECCLQCEQEQGNCTCCRICHSESDSDGNRTCKCCYHCSSTECECPPCPAAGCTSNKYDCYQRCHSCDLYHFDQPSGWCHLCHPEAYESEMTRRGISYGPRPTPQAQGAAAVQSDGGQPTASHAPESDESTVPAEESVNEF